MTVASGSPELSEVKIASNATLLLDDPVATNPTQTLEAVFNAVGAIDNVNYYLEIQGGNIKGALTIDAGATVQTFAGPDGDTPLRIESSATVVNQGSLIGGWQDSIIIQPMTIDNNGGTIANASLDEVDVEGGILVNLQFHGSNNVLDGSTYAVSVTSVEVMAGATLIATGTIDCPDGPLIVAGAATIEGGFSSSQRFDIEVVHSGTFTEEGAVSSGYVLINGGTATFDSTANVTVRFERTGNLVFAESPAFGDLENFGTTGKDTLDLENVSFAGADEATFSGNSKNGTLTITGANQTVQFYLQGDYQGVTFTATSANGGAGSIITASQTAEAATFVQAAAAFAPASASTTDTHVIATGQTQSVLNLAAGHG